MYEFYKKLCIAVFAGIMLVFSCLILCFAEEKDTLTLLSGDVSHNMTDVPPKSELKFNFNHRLDHCDNSFSITGGDAEITDWQIKGTQLTLTLSKPLAYDTQYTLSLTGLSDIYFEEYSQPIITFKTRQLELKSCGFTDGAFNPIEVIDDKASLYTVKLLNYGEEKDVWLAMSLIETESQRMEDIIFKKITLPSGECTITDGFTNIGENAENYTVKVFFLSSLQTLIPCGEEALQSITLLGKLEN